MKMKFTSYKGRRMGSFFTGKESRPAKARDERKDLLSSKSNFFIREAYKTLRTNVSFSLTGEERCKVVVVTSALQSEGKSVTAANLAISYAMTDCRVLLVDCDLRRPKLARIMSQSSKIGLSNVLMRPELLQEAILPAVVEGVDVLLAGDIPPNPSELLGSPRMERVIEELRETYDYIILDSPPVNLVTDAVVLAPKSDGVLFVVRANQSERGAVMHAVDQLSYANTKILGFVLNGVNMEKRGTYGYKKYSYRKYRYYGLYGYGRGYGYSSRPVVPYEQADQSEYR